VKNYLFRVFEKLEISTLELVLYVLSQGRKLQAVESPDPQGSLGIGA